MMAFPKKMRLVIKAIPEETSWEVNELSSNASSLHLKINIQCGKEGNSITKLSKKYIVKDAVLFQLRMDTGLASTEPCIIAPQFKNNYRYNSYSLFCIFEELPDCQNMYTADVTVTSYINNKTKTFLTCDNTWRLLVEPTTNFDVVFDIVVSLRFIDQLLRPFMLLYKDSKSTDLRLTGKDGTVDVHSAVLIAYSPVLRRKVSEIAQDSCRPYEVALPHTKHSTLQDLQDYIYLHKTPDCSHSALMDLIKFAFRYEMKELGQLCTQSLAKTVDATNFYELMHFALENDMMEFLFDILEQIEKGHISTEDIREHVYTQNAGNNS